MVTVVSHPLIETELTRLRDKNTGSKGFREAIDVLSSFLMIEATRDMALKKKEIETPISGCVCREIAAPDPYVFQILRAGEAMVPTAVRMLPYSVLGTIGLYRDEETLQPVTYFHKPVRIDRDCDIFVLDPLLATGGTSSAAISLIKNSGDYSFNIRMLSIIAAPAGLEKLIEDHPDVRIFTCAIDERLNDRGYIVPGAGDVGDRYCGTTHQSL
jgi:uracil phosphoribosyltransferase